MIHATFEVKSDDEIYSCILIGVTSEEGVNLEGSVPITLGSKTFQAIILGAPKEVADKSKNNNE